MSDGRPRSKSTFSFRSIKSDKSGKGKTDLTETDAEKRAQKMSKKTKADPNRAVNEAQPSEHSLPCCLALECVPLTLRHKKSWHCTSKNDHGANAQHIVQGRQRHVDQYVWSCHPCAVGY